MYTSAILATLLAAVATALPAGAPAISGQCTQVTLDVFDDAPVAGQLQEQSPVPIQVGYLQDFGNTSLQAYGFDFNREESGAPSGETPLNCDIAAIECFAFSDSAGTKPLSGGFGFNNPFLPPNGEELNVGSICCNVAGQGACKPAWETPASS